jgi:uncharacterized membrane protein YdjX (TVP38/TMEM64 family)
VVGCAIGNLIIFVSIRQLSGIITLKRKPKPKHKQFLSKEELDKVKRPEIVIFCFFLIPMMPTSALTFIFADSKISLIRYMIASMLGTVPAAIVYAVLGDHLSQGNYTTAIVIGVILIIAIVFFMIFKKKLKNSILKQSS